MRSRAPATRLARPRMTSASSRARGARSRASSRLGAGGLLSLQEAAPRRGRRRARPGRRRPSRRLPVAFLAEAVVAVELLRRRRPAASWRRRLRAAGLGLGVRASTRLSARWARRAPARSRPRSAEQALAGRSSARERGQLAQRRERAERRLGRRLTRERRDSPPAKIASSRTATSSTLGENTNAVIVHAAARTAALPMATRQNSAGPRERAITGARSTGFGHHRHADRSVLEELAAGTPPVKRPRVPVGPTSMSQEEALRPGRSGTIGGTPYSMAAGNFDAASVCSSEATRSSDVAAAIGRLRVLAQQRVERFDRLALEAVDLLEVAGRARVAALAVLAQRLADRGDEAAPAPPSAWRPWPGRAGA